jgi:hypothetical protein
MNLLFSYTSAAQIKAIDFRNYYVGIQANMTWQSFAPFVDPATREHLLPFVGRSFHDALVTALDGGNPSAEILEAGSLARRCLAQFMIWDALPTFLANLSDLGLQSMSDREGTSNGSPQWVYYQNRRNLMLKAGKYLDQLLAFLDKQVVDGNAEFSAYADDDARKYLRSDFFRSPVEMDRYLNIQGSRRAFNVIIPHFTYAERRQLVPVLSQPFYDEVKAMAAAASPSDLETELVELCQHYVSQLGFQAALPSLTCVISGDGIQIVSSTDGFEDKRGGSGGAFQQAVIIRLQDAAEVRGKGALKDLQEFLRVNVATFTTYADNQPADVETENVICEEGGGAVGLF